MDCVLDAGLGVLVGINRGFSFFLHQGGACRHLPEEIMKQLTGWKTPFSCIGGRFIGDMWHP